MSAIRHADAIWNGALIDGRGTVTAVSSTAFTDLPVTWASRTEAADGRTSPEELLASAHATCYSMSFAGSLGRNGTPPERLDVRATVTFDKLEAGWTVVSSALTVRGSVPGIDAAKFRELAEVAKDGCPISRALKSNVRLSVDATLTE